jgi:lipopolysaccharide/colanic/teichoic acid biosynthesis glycosyltransferase
MKRLFDIVTAGVALVLLSPLFLLIAVIIKIDSPGPVFFRQERIGKDFHPFQIYKFRTMRRDAEKAGALVTAGEDARVTRAGRYLRRTKLDELPQFINIVKGEMSLVGPRPEVSRYVELFRPDYEEILRVRPGLTDLASLKYRDEAGLLGSAADPEREYLAQVLPDKLKMAKDYLRQSSFVFDLRLIGRTLVKIIDYRTSH